MAWRRHMPWLAALMLALFAVCAPPAMAAEAAHGEGKAASSPELPNIITIALKAEVNGKTLEDVAPGFAHFIHAYEYQIFAVFIAALSSLFIFGTLRLRAERPGRLQAFLELIVEG